MIEPILDYILSDPNLSLEEVVNIIDFYTQQIPPQKLIEIKEDLKHAFNE